MATKRVETVPGQAGTDLDLEALEQAYQKTRSDAIWVQHEPPAGLRLKGPDRVDLLERLSTNTLVDRTSWEHVQTALLEANGQLIDLLDVFILESEIILLASPGLGGTVESWLRQHIFFNDDVHLAETSDWPFAASICGPGSARILQKRLQTKTSFTQGRVTQSEGVLILPFEWHWISGYQVFGTDEDAAELVSAVSDADDRSAEFNAYEALRIESGVPRRGREITAGIIPLEAGLADTISFTKGCYIGQEIIARLESRGKLAARLFGIQLTAPASPGDLLTQHGKPVGELTSSAYSPVHGWIGLGYLKRRRWDGSSDDLSIDGHPAQAVELPFNNN